MNIDHTSLILNEDGSVYHLSLLPGELATTIILVGDPDRSAQIAKNFDRIDVHKQNREFLTYTGTLGKKHLSVVSTGIGIDNIDIVLNEIDALWNIDLQTREAKSNVTALKLVRLGTAGALQADIPIDSLVLSQQAITFNSLMSYYQHGCPDDTLLTAVKQHFHDLPAVNNAYLAQGSDKLITLFSPHCRSGITLTTEGFYGPQHRQLRAPLIHTDVLTLATHFHYKQQKILNFEMETAAIYGLSQLLGHQCCSISVILNNRINDTVSGDPHAAVEHLIATALDVLRFTD